MTQPYMVGCCCDGGTPTCFYLAQRCACSSSSAPLQLAVDCTWLQTTYPNGLTFAWSGGGFSPLPCYEVSQSSPQVQTTTAPIADPTAIMFFGALGQCSACCGSPNCQNIPTTGILSYGGATIYGGDVFVSPLVLSGSHQFPPALAVNFPFPTTLTQIATGNAQQHCGSAVTLPWFLRVNFQCFFNQPGLPQYFTILFRALINNQCAQRTYSNIGTQAFGTYLPQIPVFGGGTTPTHVGACTTQQLLYGAQCTNPAVAVQDANFPASLTLSP